MWKSWVKGKSSINLTSLVEFEHHLMADTIWNENEEKKIKVKAPVMAKKNKQHQTGYGDIDFKVYTMILGGFRGNSLKIRVLCSCSENLVQLR